MMCSILLRWAIGDYILSSKVCSKSLGGIWKIPKSVIEHKVSSLLSSQEEALHKSFPLLALHVAVKLIPPSADSYVHVQHVVTLFADDSLLLYGVTD